MKSGKAQKNIASPRKKANAPPHREIPLQSSSLPPLQKDTQQAQQKADDLSHKQEIQSNSSLPPLNKIDKPIFKYLIDINNYEIIKNICTGEFSIINLVQNKKTGDKFVTKTNLIKENSQHQKFIAREINILIRIQNPSIIRYYGFSFHDFDGKDNITIFMDYIQSESLSNLFQKGNNFFSSSNFNNTRQQIIITGISYGMMILHNHHCIHRDLKPENILIDKNYRPHITDFGLLKIFNPQNSIVNKNSITYLAPEIIKNGYFTPKSDVYSFGILMYEILTGTRAYEEIIRKEKLNSDSLSIKILEGLRPEFKNPIKKGLKQMIEKCWSQDPKVRPTFCEIFRKLSLSQTDFIIEEKEAEEEFPNMAFCLDGVDIDELLDYVDEISEEKVALDEKEAMTNKIEEIRGLLQNQEQIISQLTNDNSKLMKINSHLRNDNHRMKSRISKLEQQLEKSLTVDCFNNLPLKQQQMKISEIISNHHPLNPFYSNLNELLSYFLVLNQSKSCRFLEIIYQNQDESMIKIKSECKIYLFASATLNLIKNKSLTTPKFIEILNKFETIFIELAYPSNTFKADYEKVLKLKNEGIGRIKIAILITCKEKTDFNFQKNQNVDLIKIGASVISIDNGKSELSGCFSMCSSLTSVKIGSSVHSIGKFAFSQCSALKEVDIPFSVTTIEESAFYYCSSLREIKIPSSVTMIEKLAFSGCSSLKEVEIPSSVKTMGESVFSGCSSITEFEVPSSLSSIAFGSFYGCSSLKKVKIPSSIRTICDHSFYDCCSLKELNIPSSVRSIGEFAFSECSSLTEIEIPSSVTSIGESAFAKCSSLTKADILSNLTTINESTFAYCTSLTNLEIPSSLKSIKWGAFYGCSSLMEMKIPSLVTSIGDSAFCKCLSLVEIEIGSSVSLIGKYAFAECLALKEVKIPNSVESIGDSAFDKCSSLSKVEISSSLNNISEIFPKKAKIMRY